MKNKEVLDDYLKEIEKNYFNRKQKERYEIIDLWNQGVTLQGIESKGYCMVEVLQILDEYTKEQAKGWLL